MPVIQLWVLKVVTNNLPIIKPKNKVLRIMNDVAKNKVLFGGVCEVPQSEGAKVVIIIAGYDIIEKNA